MKSAKTMSVSNGSTTVETEDVGPRNSRVKRKRNITPPPVNKYDKRARHSAGMYSIRGDNILKAREHVKAAKNKRDAAIANVCARAR